MVIIYKNKKPYGIRDESGFLLYFASIDKYQGKDERYREEIKKQSELANRLLRFMKWAEIHGREFDIFGDFILVEF